MSLRLLDTNTWIAVARGEPDTVERLRALDPSRIAPCSIVRDHLAGAHYGLARAALERAGTPIGANDMLIASIALAHDCLLVTRNCREFERVVGLRVETWA